MDTAPLDFPGVGSECEVLNVAFSCTLYYIFHMTKNHCQVVSYRNLKYECRLDQKLMVNKEISPFYLKESCHFSN